MPTGNGPKLGELRRAQLVSTHGPGAVVDYLAAGNAPVSGVTTGLDDWSLSECRRLVDPVLERLLGAPALYEPPVSLGAGANRRVHALPATRFPRWQECPDCGRLRDRDRWQTVVGTAGLFCGHCRTGKNRMIAVVPARLMVICERGHLDDFPWLEWIDHPDGCQRHGKLRLSSRGAGLRNLWVNCDQCGKGRNLRDAFNHVQLREAGGGCTGKRPWLGTDAAESCDARSKEITAALRGGSNLYFPYVASALTIPPWSGEFKALLERHDLWGEIRGAMDDLEEDGDEKHFDRCLDKIARRLARALDPDVADIPAARRKLDAMLAVLKDLPGPETADGDVVLRREEWRQFRDATGPWDDTFQLRQERVPDELSRWVSAIVRVPRIREVKALRGFTRRYPHDGTNRQDIAPLSLRAKWRPAIATSGEGIFIALKEDEVAKWASGEAVRDRALGLHEEWVASWRQRFGYSDETPPQSVTPRSLLVHGLSHALMLELSITSGYGSASLQERLYVGEGREPMAGFLIYTATSDAEGTLGGLEREGISERIVQTMLQALQRLKWCSSDPLCMKGVSTTSDPLNGAACHSCLFVSETSCELFNRSLDRAMLVGGAGVRGYFGSPLRCEPA